MPTTSRSESLTVLVLGPMGLGKGAVVQRTPRTLGVRRIVRTIAQGLSHKVKLKVVSPESGPGNVIISHVLDLIDEADLIILDLTQGSANVAYEAGIVHALAVPFILLTGDDRPPFYFAQMRCIRKFREHRRYDPLDPTHRALKKAIDEFTRAWTPNLYNNHLTQHFGLPIVDLAGPSGLAAGYYVNGLRRFIRQGGFLDDECKVSWVPPNLPAGTPRPQATLDIEHFIAVEPPSNLLGTYANDVTALSSALKKHNLISVLSTVEKRKDEAQDIRDFSGQFLASRRRGKVELIEPGIVIDMPSTLFALRFSPLVLRIDGLIRGGVARGAVQERKRRRLAQMLSSFKRNLWFQIEQEMPPGNSAKFSFVTLDQLPDLLRKLKVIPRRRRRAKRG